MPSTLLITRLSAIAKARRDSVPSAERIVGEAAKRLGLDWRDCTPTERLKLLHEVRLLARAWLRREAEKAATILYPDEATKGLFGAAKAAAESFFKRAGKLIRNAVLAGWVAVMGPGELNPVMAQAVSEQVQVQHTFLGAFKQEIMEEEKKLLPARAEQYGDSVWGATHNAIRKVIARTGVFHFERRVHLGPETADDPCGICRSQRNKGIVPIGTLLPIGDSPCKSRCHCRFGWYVTKDGVEHIGGDPLYEPAFRTR